MMLPHDFHFLRPLWLWALPALWAIALWLGYRQGKDGNWDRLIDADLLPSLRLAAAGRKTASPWPWLALAWTLAVLALAGPSWQRDASAAFKAPSAWVVVLDLSPSMRAQDVTPDRATRARYAIADLLSGARDTRIGLIVFGEEAFTVTPLTDDVATVRAMLPAIDPSIMPTAGDKLAPALVQASQLLQQSGEKHGQIIVLTDGFNDPADAFTEAEKLSRQGYSINVLGVGTSAGAPLPGDTGGFVRDNGGKPRLAQLDRAPLKQLASSGGGSYADLSALPDLLASLQSHSESGQEVQSVSGVSVAHWLDAGYWLILPLLLLAAVLGRRGWL